MALPEFINSNNLQSRRRVVDVVGLWSTNQSAGVILPGIIADKRSLAKQNLAVADQSVKMKALHN